MKLSAFLTFAALGALAAGSASAETFVVSVPQSNVLATYEECHMPAKILVNTKGQLVSRETQAWAVAGPIWTRVRNPAVYIETRKMIAPSYTTLVGVGAPCP